MKVKDLDLDFSGIKAKIRKGHSTNVRRGTVHHDKTKWSTKDRRSSKQNLRRNVSEQQVLTNVRLTDHQKAVLCNMVTRGEQPTTLVDLTSNVDDNNRQNITSAVITLARVGLVTINPDRTVSITDEGTSALKQANLIDDTGQLTQEGQQAQFKFTRGEEGKDQTDVNNTVGQTDMAQPADTMSTQPKLGESFKLIQDVMANHALNEELKSFY